MTHRIMKTKQRGDHPHPSFSQTTKCSFSHRYFRNLFTLCPRLALQKRILLRPHSPVKIRGSWRATAGNTRVTGNEAILSWWVTRKWHSRVRWTSSNRHLNTTPHFSRLRTKSGVLTKGSISWISIPKRDGKKSWENAWVYQTRCTQPKPWRV